MTEQQVVAGVIDWIRATVPEVAANAYDYMPSGKVKGLPDVAGDVVSSEIVRDDPDFPFGGLQQTLLHVRRLAFSFMVEAGVEEDATRAATLQLRSTVDRLRDALLGDLTLGGRVPMTSPFMLVDYEPAFIEYADGTRGRECTVQIAVAELVAIEE